MNASSSQPLESSRRQAFVEVAAIFAMFFLFACSPTPGVNETHYLIKAKHYWNPSWCAADRFLQSADAHEVFYWTCGWLTLWLPLDAVAWVGRSCTWLLLAWSWRRMSWAVQPRPWLAILSAGLFLVFLKRCHMAGEWVVGGLEAKGFAYAFIFLGLEAIVRNRWSWVFPWFGLAAAFHVIVGGWAVVLGIFTWLLLFSRGEFSEGRAALRELIISLVVGGLLSLPGLLPCLLLNRGTAPEVVREGNLIYVFVRLQHHLVISSFSSSFWWRHGLEIAALWLLGWQISRREKIHRLFLFTAGCLLLLLTGLAIDRATPSLGRETAASLLRYYWYRMSDAITPIALSFTLLWWWSQVRLRWLQALGTSLALVVIAWNLGDVAWQRHRLDVPDSMLTWLKSKSEFPFSKRELYSHWLACCDWIRTHTAEDDLFMTTSTPASFVWHAQRAEVMSLKNAPQDAQGLVDWLHRFEDVRNQTKLHPPEIDSELPLPLRWKKVAEKYQAKYVVIERRKEPLPGWLRVYPDAQENNPTFAVYRLPE